MSAAIEQAMATAAAEAAASLPVRKRMRGEDAVKESEAPDAKVIKRDETKVIKTEEKPPQTIAAPQTTTHPGETNNGTQPAEKAPMSKAREVRLEQNRKAARESRRRKKVMIEELQRSVIFFSRANGTLKQQNGDLSRMLMQARAQVSAIEQQAAQKSAQEAEKNSAQQPAPAPAAKPEAAPQPQQQQQQGSTSAFQQAQAQAVATQAMFESQGFPAAAARAAAQTMTGSTSAALPPGAQTALPAMQPGATMQAMANFQQAAAAAMQSAMQGMQGIPGVNTSQLAAAPAGTNAQQAYTDTMTALAMQQAAAAAAAGHQFGMQSFMPHPMMAWPQPGQIPPYMAPQPAPTPQQNAPAPPPQNVQAPSAPNAQAPAAPTKEEL